MGDAEDALLQQLLQHLIQIGQAAGFTAEETIDDEQCRTILEATAGDIDAACQLYMDDYLARSRSPDSRVDGSNNNNNRSRHRNGHGASDNNNDNNNDNNPSNHNVDVTNNNNEELDDSGRAQPRQRRVRRRENRLLYPVRDSRDQEESGAGNGPRRRLDNEFQEVALRPADHETSRRQNPRREADNGVERLAARAAAVWANREPDNDESVSVSDDESGGVWRMVGGIAARLNRDESGGDQRAPPPQRVASIGVGRAAEDYEDSQEPLRKRRKTDDNKENMLDEDGYLSESDWIWESLQSRKQSRTGDLLWGSTRKENAPSRPQAQAAAPGDIEVEGNVIVDDDGDDETPLERSNIPRAWLRTGFQLSEDRVGLALPAATDEDIAAFSWQQQTQADGSVVRVPPSPLHCGSITALLSVVTGLLYSGISFQKDCVSSSSARKPFGELTKEERKREFESRLADVLAALLLIAAQASMARKARGLEKMKKSKNPKHTQMWQTLEGRLRLCPTCCWEMEGAEFRLPRVGDADRPLQVTYTNVEDLRSYVVSNMRAFTGQGGCALFLETLTRIHGKGVIQRMIEKVSKENQSKCLIDCKCAEKHIAVSIPSNQVRQRTKAKELMEAVPGSSNCMAVELLSLLLTGKVQPSLKGWSSGKLGIGLLSHNLHKVGKGLTRPSKPVWIIQGPSVYSVVWMSGGYGSKDAFAAEDNPESVVQMTHFCSWPGQRHTTEFRLARGRIVTKPRPSLETEYIDPSLVVDDEELDRVEANEEDATFYKDNFRMWRFRFRDSANNLSGWQSFYRLTPRQKQVVVTKLGPQLSRILWTRWPHSIIDGFDPTAPAPIV